MCACVYVCGAWCAIVVCTFMCTRVVLVVVPWPNETPCLFAGYNLVVLVLHTAVYMLRSVVVVRRWDLSQLSQLQQLSVGAVALTSQAPSPIPPVHAHIVRGRGHAERGGGWGALGSGF